MCDGECCAELAVYGYFPVGLILIFLWIVFVFLPLIYGRYMFVGLSGENLSIVISVFFPIITGLYCCGLGAIVTCFTKGCRRCRRHRRKTKTIKQFDYTKCPD